MREAMPAPNFEGGKKNIEMDPDKRLINSLAELKEKEGEIIKKINDAEGDEKQILKMDLDNIKHQIKSYEDSVGRSFKRNIKRKKNEKFGKQCWKEKISGSYQYQKRKSKKYKINR